MWLPGVGVPQDTAVEAQHHLTLSVSLLRLHPCPEMKHTYWLDQSSRVTGNFPGLLANPSLLFPLSVAAYGKQEGGLWLSNHSSSLPPPEVRIEKLNFRQVGKSVSRRGVLSVCGGVHSKLFFFKHLCMCGACCLPLGINRLGDKHLHLLRQLVNLAEFFFF